MKDCLIIGPAYVFNYNDVYPLLLDKTLKVGVLTVGWGNIICNWFTTLQVNRPEEKKLKLTKTYNPDDYPRFDNAPDIIESKSKDIPVDYQGLIAVPITIFQYDLDNILVKIDQQPERPLRKKIVIRGIWADDREEADFIVKGTPTYVDEKQKKYQGPVVNGKAKYARVVINLANRKRS